MKSLSSSRTVAALICTLGLVVGSTAFSRSLLGYAASEEQTTTRLVAAMVSRYHLSQKPVDDTISAALLKGLLKSLDPQKLYFTKSDIESFDKYKTHLDDFIKAGNVDFMHHLFDLYLKRLDERVELAHRLIDAPHDFTLNETLSTDYEKMDWSSGDELNDRWRKRVKYEILVLMLDNVSSTELQSRLHKRYDTAKRSAHDMEDAEVLELYLTSFAHCFDPHTAYMSPHSNEDFQISMSLHLEGIGAALRSEDGYTIVANVVDGGAAFKDGRLKKGDRIIAVGQEEGDFKDIVEMKLSHVVRLIRGKANSKVRLKVVPRDEKDVTKTVVYELTRQRVDLQDQAVKGEIINLQDRVPGLSGRIGIVNIPSFYRDFQAAQRGAANYSSTSRDVLKVLRDFQAQGGVDGVIVDLRTNGGGALAEAIEVSGLFIDEGPIVQIREQNGRIKTADDEDKGVAFDGPLTVLCNRFSASASEIFAGAIKDYSRGIIIGDTTTHGKGTVQNVMPVSNQMFSVVNGTDRGAVKLTINQFYRVNGESTQREGVKSDVVLPSFLDHLELGEAFLDNAMPFDQIRQAPHSTYNLVKPDWIKSLRESSAKRVGQDEQFQKLGKDIARYESRKNRKFVSLNLETLKTEREADRAVEDVQKEQEEKESNPGKGPVFPKGYYNDEVLRITGEYTGVIRANGTASTR